MAHDDEDDEGFEIEDVKCIHATADALKCVTSNNDAPMPTGRPFWVPKSQVHENSEVYRDQDEGSLVVKTWFAKTQDWLDDE